MTTLTLRRAPAHTGRRGVAEIVVVVARRRRLRRKVGGVVPVGGAQLHGGLGQAFECGNEIGQATLFGARLGERQPLSYCHVRFTETETPSPTGRNDV